MSGGSPILPGTGRGTTEGGGGASEADPHTPLSAAAPNFGSHKATKPRRRPRHPEPPPPGQVSGPGVGVRHPKPCAPSHPGKDSVVHAETAEGKRGAEGVFAGAGGEGGAELCPSDNLAQDA
jgi:hypothetical protein